MAVELLQFINLLLARTSHLKQNFILLTRSIIDRSSADINYFTAQHTIFSCLDGPPPNQQNNLTDSMFIEQVPDLLDYGNNLPGFACLVGDMNFYNPLQSLTKHTLTTLSLCSLVQVINKPTHMCGNIIDCVDVRPDDDIHRKYTVTDS